MGAEVISMDLWAIAKISLISGWHVTEAETSPLQGFLTVAPSHPITTWISVTFPPKWQERSFGTSLFLCRVIQLGMDWSACTRPVLIEPSHQDEERNMWACEGDCVIQGKCQLSSLCHCNSTSQTVLPGPFHPDSLKACQHLIHLTKQSAVEDSGQHTAAFPWRTERPLLSHLSKRCFRRNAGR